MQRVPDSGFSPFNFDARYRRIAVKSFFVQVALRHSREMTLLRWPKVTHRTGRSCYRVWATRIGAPATRPTISR